MPNYSRVFARIRVPSRIVSGCNHVLPTRVVISNTAESCKEGAMLGMLILLGLLAGLVVVDLAALCWAFDSRDATVHYDIRWRWRGKCDE